MIDDIRRKSPALNVSQTSDQNQKTTSDVTDLAESIPTSEELIGNSVSAQDTTNTTAEPERSNDHPTEKAALTAQQTSSHNRAHFHWPLSKKITISAVLVIILLGAAGSAFAFMQHPKKVVAASKSVSIAKPKPTAFVPTTVPSALSGLPVNPSVNNGPVTAVMVENSTFARPQSGLSQASVVFEAIAEGGITRFMALYQDTAPNNVGPIRSVRPYYEEWALGFDAALAHVGGSPEALADIKTWNVRDLDQFYNGSYYHRITTREAPHNVYTAIATLNQLEASKGYTTSTFTSFPRQAADPAKTPTAGTINLTLSSSTYDVSYSYDATTNSYNRSEAGAPQIDANTNTQISPKVVVAMVVPYSLEADGYHSDYAVIGSGPVNIFQDGTVTQGIWTKTSNTSQISFKTASGKTIKLIPGQTWITAVAGTDDISYTP
jgi:hypothetical protein